MTDIVSTTVRSRMMSNIRAKDTKPELIIRKGLHAAGFRYKLHDRRLSGKPDMVFPKWQAVVFVHGCFWHEHDCHLFRLPATRTEFWQDKITGNKKRDQKAVETLEKSGWRIGTVWECALKGKTRLPLVDVIGALTGWLRGSGSQFEVRGAG